MAQQKVKQPLSYLLRKSIATPHNRIVTSGLLVGLIYFPFWLQDVLAGTLMGSASLLMVSAIALGLYLLWTERRQLAKFKVAAEDRWLGHLITIAGVGLFPFCLSTDWAQNLVWLLILCGIAISSWGIPFFQRYFVPSLLIFIGFFPHPYIVGRALWDTFTPPQMLERFMAWGGGIGLQLIGQSATITDTVIALPGGAVRVDWGCNGFDMAVTMAAASLILGLFLKQNLPKLIVLVVIGVVMALIANIPRIMLMAIAEAYWGKASFEFWHGFWGGQIFSGIMFTIYYYVVIAIVKGQSGSKSVSSP